MVQIIKVLEKKRYTIEDLLDIIHILRSPGGCPWDIEQTHESIRSNILEEAYEVADSIDNGDKKALCEELGDVLLQVVFHSEIAVGNGGFNFGDVVDGICKKMILRHPHVFGNVKADNSEEVLKNWDNIKKEEKHQETFTDTLKSVPRAFPALLRAQKIQKRAAKAGMDWDSDKGAIQKLSEELEEVKEAVNQKDTDSVYEEMGDLLFSVVNVARHLKVDAEDALASATDKFVSRFARVEEKCKEAKIEMDKTSLETLDKFWDEVK